MISTVVDNHKGARSHVAVDALSACALEGVIVMSRGVEGFAQVALAAKRVARGLEFLRVWLVTVAAGHSLFVHSALQKRPPHIDLLADLSVGKIQRWID